MDLEHDPDVWIERDDTGVRQVLHLARPFGPAHVASETDLTLLYLHTHASVFKLDRAVLPPVAGMPPLPFRARLARACLTIPLLGRMFGSSFADGIRLAKAFTLVRLRNDSVAVTSLQVERVHVGWWDFIDLPVWGASIRVMVARSPLRVTAVYSTLRADAPAIVSRPRFPATPGDAGKELGIPVEDVEGVFMRAPAARGMRPRAEDLGPVLVRRRLEYPASGTKVGRWLPYREHVDLVSQTVVRRGVIASHATGLVFTVDPSSQTARARPRPYRPAGELDAFRVARPLRDLAAPVSGQQRLEGLRVYVAPDNPLGIAPPTEAVGASFDYTSRSDDFAAVSAYYHCDAACRMVEALGFSLADYFAANVAAGEFPLRLVHRAPIRPGRAVFDGRTVNAQVVGGGGSHVVGEIRFAFGDVSDWARAPLGIAADARFAWHEFGHVLLIAATGEPEFPFAHSAGDALAAIICDLDSRIGELAAPWRGVTFPWIEALRRHDRKPDDGWAWHGSLYSAIRDVRDAGGYRGEQILSSTLFRLYRALGGDALRVANVPDLVRRRAAAAYTVYLIVSAIKALGDASGSEGLDAYGLAGAMIALDIATHALLPDHALYPPFKALARRGGAVHKVVRWAFERQGLYAPGSGARIWDGPGDAPPVDVYIEDRQARGGHYDYTANWSTDPPDLRVARQPNPGAPDANPRRNTPNYVFVRVQNRGTDPMPLPATVRVFTTRQPGANPPRWRLAPGPPNRWREALPATGGTNAAVVASGAFVDFGPFEWRPDTLGRHAVLACVDAPGDRCNALVPTYACAVGPTRIVDLAPLDNNIGFRNVIVVP
jgi:hypothetical protein